MLWFELVLPNRLFGLPNAVVQFLPGNACIFSFFNRKLFAKMKIHFGKTALKKQQQVFIFTS